MQPWCAKLGVLAPRTSRAGDHASLAGSRVPANRDALVHKRRHRDLPALADTPDTVAVGNASVGHEDLVELGLASDLAERPDFDAGLGHIQREIREPLV